MAAVPGSSGVRASLSLYLALVLHALLLLSLWLAGLERPPTSEPTAAGEAARAGQTPQLHYDGALGPLLAAPAAPRQASPAAGARPVDRSAALTGPGLDRGRRRSSADPYFDRLRRHLGGFRQPPPADAQPGLTARVAFRIEPSGAVSALQLVQASGDPRLDAAALDLIRAAAPLPAPGEARRLQLPLSWRTVD